MIKKLATFALFLFLPMLMLYPLWGNPLSAGEDDVIYYYPLRKMAFEQIRQGQWPMWNSREVTGVPLFADPQSGLLFPPNWLCAVLPLKLAYSLSVFLAFSLAGWGAQLYLRKIGLARTAAIFGGVVFMFCGFMVGHRVHLSMIQTAGFLPWGLLAVETMRQDRRRGFALLAGTLALALAAGHWPTVIHMGLAWAVYFLVRARPFFKSLLAGIAAAMLAALLVLPQVVATVGFLSHSVRSNTTYLTATENSFFPLDVVLAFFPLLMGCRNNNCIAWQGWWGPWHLCEMLGYVGLVTLVLAAAAVWRLYRRRAWQAGVPAKSADQSPPGQAALPGSGMVKLWTWLGAGAFVFMLGWNTGPLYKLIYMLPGLDKVRCPARMVVLLDLALAVLAAIGLNWLMHAQPAPGQEISPLGRTIRRLSRYALPGAMALSLGLVGLFWLVGRPLTNFLSAQFDNVIWSLRPRSPAIWVWLLLAGLTIAVLSWVVRRPGRRGAVLVALAVVDLFFITRFVDMPARSGPDPEVSPAAAWLRENGGQGKYRIWGLGRYYNYRPNELLLPKTSQSLGFDDINCYGPFQPIEHAMLLNMRPWGQTREWPQLLRRNHLLSIFNVRYILAAQPEFRQVLESVVVPDNPPPGDGPEMLSDQWPRMEHIQSPGTAAEGGREYVLHAPGVLSPAVMEQPVRVQAGAIYRIRLDCRAPRGMENHLRAELALDGNNPGVWDDCGQLRVDSDQLLPGGPWRHFEWTFQAPQDAGGQGIFRLVAASPSRIEVRNLSLRPSSWETPTNFGGRLAPLEHVYIDRTPQGLPPRRRGYQPVHIYENRLCLPRQFPVSTKTMPDQWSVVEALRWNPEKYDFSREALVTAALLERDGTFCSQSYKEGDRRVQANSLGRLQGVDGASSGGNPSGQGMPGWFYFAWLGTSLLAGLLLWRFGRIRIAESANRR
jgi:hypothetical protein